jgi:hypothetical protein
MEKLNTCSIDDVLESSDICMNHISLMAREIRELQNEQNPSVKCAVCDGYDYNCPKHCSEEKRNYNITPSSQAFP